MRFSPSISETLTIVVVVLAVMFPAVAAAQTDAERSTRHFEAGAEAYFAGEYARAVVEFQKAHQLDPDPLLLYNLALAYFRLDNHVEALNAARRASAEVEDLPEEVRSKFRGRHVGFGRVVGAIRLSERAAASRVEVEGVTGAAAPEVEVVETPAPARSGLGAFGWSGVVLGVGGAAVLGAAIGLDVSMADELEAYRNAAERGDSVAYTELENDLEDRQRTVRTLVFAGGGAVAVGATLLVVDLAGAGSETVSASLTAGPRGTLVTLDARF